MHCTSEHLAPTEPMHLTMQLAACQLSGARRPTIPGISRSSADTGDQFLVIRLTRLAYVRSTIRIRSVVQRHDRVNWGEGCRRNGANQASSQSIFNFYSTPYTQIKNLDVRPGCLKPVEAFRQVLLCTLAKELTRWSRELDRVCLLSECLFAGSHQSIILAVLVVNCPSPPCRFVEALNFQLQSTEFS